MEVSAAIITDGEKVLCFRKGESNYKSLSHRFEFPGGKIEFGETPEQALVRELKEELKYETTINSLKFYKVIDYDYEDFSVKLYYFIIQDSQPSYSLSEHLEAIWVPKDSLLSLDWVGADATIVRMMQDLYI